MATTAQDFHGAKVALFIGPRLVTILRDDIPGIPWPGWWDFPGGGRDGAETPFQTARRETREELGLDLTEDAILWQMHSTKSDDVAARVWFFVARLPASAEGGIVFGDAGQRHALRPLEEVLTMDRIVPNLPARLRLWLKDGGTPPTI